VGNKGLESKYKHMFCTHPPKKEGNLASDFTSHAHFLPCCNSLCSNLITNQTVITHYFLWLRVVWSAGTNVLEVRNAASIFSPSSS
jgi:hypothetical protein